MTTWQERIHALLPDRGYEQYIRRSLQTVILYEAKRCLVDQIAAMRPFQRKAAFLDQCHALAESLTFLQPHERQEVFWRTASGKEPVRYMELVTTHWYRMSYFLFVTTDGCRNSLETSQKY